MNTLSISLTVTLALVVPARPAWAQTVDEVIEKSVAADEWIPDSSVHRC